VKLILRNTVEEEEEDFGQCIAQFFILGVWTEMSFCRGEAFIVSPWLQISHTDVTPRSREIEL